MAEREDAGRFGNGPRLHGDSQTSLARVRVVPPHVRRDTPLKRPPTSIGRTIELLGLVRPQGGRGMASKNHANDLLFCIDFRGFDLGPPRRLLLQHPRDDSSSRQRCRRPSAGRSMDAMPASCGRDRAHSGMRNDSNAARRRKNPSGPTIDMFVKRYKPKGGKSLRAVWFLHKGAQGPRDTYSKGFPNRIETKFPDVDFYMPDHRGTGKSTRLGCAVQEASDSEGGIAITDAEWPACLADVKAREGGRLPFFNVTNAANDLGVMIARTKPEGQPVFVYGVSYGTYWAHRYLQLYPNQANGVVFDSIFPQGGSLARQDADANEAAKLFLRCAERTRSAAESLAQTLGGTLKRCAEA